ncbi:MAG: hypothetical protein GXY18_07990 [Methanomicrobiales archaeon]|nr:hypothetical protein [Methanomicrobiales archaeon]
MTNPVDEHIQHFHTLLERDGHIRIKDIEPGHAAMDSSLHYHAGSSSINVSAFYYAAMRLPRCIDCVRTIIISSDLQSMVDSGFPIYDWEEVRTEGRRRKCYYDKNFLLAAHMSSVSDIDDIITIITTFQIEWNKIHDCLSRPNEYSKIKIFHQMNLYLTGLDPFQKKLNISHNDWKLFLKLCSGDPESFLLTIGSKRLDFHIQRVFRSNENTRSHLDAWWEGLVASCPYSLSSCPVYFVSANIYSIPSLVTGFLDDDEALISSFLDNSPDEVRDRLHMLLSDDDDSRIKNLLHYCNVYYSETGSLSHSTFEKDSGIIRFQNSSHFDLNACIIPIQKLSEDRIDSRIRIRQSDVLQHSDALIIIIDYPLGSAAHDILSLILEKCTVIGIYIFGKAGTLRNRIGDIIIPSTIWDTFSGNKFRFHNCYSASNIRKHTSWTAVLEDQKSVTVKGTLLQNRKQMRKYFSQGFNTVEMESGPYLTALAEYWGIVPEDSIVWLNHDNVLDFGLIHYVSDAPFNRRETLLSYEGWYNTLESVYACSIATLNLIFKKEIDRIGKSP